MKTDDLQAALHAAQTFLDRSKACRPEGHGRVETGKAAAALKRASLELTNALVKIRK
jgi:hypothetical protein